MVASSSAVAQRVGLALSGGGYRAAGFHLGVLSYLDRVELLGGLRALSTVSGGSFTGASYALTLVAGQRFDAFFDRFYRTLRDTNLVELALRRLAEDATDVPSGRRDLSVAIADVYSDAFFPDGAGSSHCMRALIEADIPLERLIINATEFRGGEVFRFMRGGASGSDAIPLAEADAAAIRVGDAVATSACFPGGFEPLMFPDDFQWPDLHIPAETRARFSEDGALRSLPLMDGGIIDNQGVESLLRADADGEPLDLLVISDVDQEVADLYPAPAASDGGGRRLSTVGIGSTALVLLGTVSTAVALVELVRMIADGRMDSVWKAITAVLPLILAIAVLGALWWLNRQFVKVVLPSVPQVGERSARYLRRLRVRQLGEMLSLRVSSLLALTNKIFMRRLRNTGYLALHREPQNDARAVTVRIVTLREGRDAPAIPGVDPASPALRDVATRAADVPTLLWFTDERQLPGLVAAGQAALCHELLRYLLRRHGARERFSPAAEALWTRLADDWALLNRDPFALVRDRGIEPPDVA